MDKSYFITIRCPNTLNRNFYGKVFNNFYNDYELTKDEIIFLKLTYGLEIYEDNTGNCHVFFSSADNNSTMVHVLNELRPV